MAGTVEGGKKAAKTIKEKYGDDFYHNLGQVGGRVSRGGGFAANPQLAHFAGRQGARKRWGKILITHIMTTPQEVEVRHGN